jgi:hypothetical protein
MNNPGYGRTDLRDRFVRLATRGIITIAAQAMETAGDTVGRYLLQFALINLGFGITAGLTVWLLGLPHPEFWGGPRFPASLHSLRRNTEFGHTADPGRFCSISGMGQTIVMLV